VSRDGSQSPRFISQIVRFKATALTDSVSSSA
jgi:hypothetical protein